MYKFLVTNDDGYNAPGIHALAKSLSRLGEVYVVAPVEQQSAKSMALTFRTTVTATPVEIDGAREAFSLTGTPVDCVKWGLDYYDEMKFDYVISGINSGYNHGSAQYYSGTVAAAREGALTQIHSLALSVESHEASHFEFICAMLPELLDMSRKLDPSTLLSVNAPNLPDWKIKGVRLVPGAAHDAGENYHFTDEGDGIYQMGARFAEADEAIESDYNLAKLGFATITPITADVSDVAALSRLKGFAVEDPIFIFLDAQEEIANGIRKTARWKYNIHKWARCINRLDMPALISEQHGLGETIEEIAGGLDRVEKVERREFNAMDSTDFVKLISTGANKSVYIAGLQTHVAIQMTALELVSRGYDVVVIENCCGAGTAEDHNVAIDNMRAAGCRIMTYEAAIMELLGSSSHQAYRSIMSILGEE